MAATPSTMVPLGTPAPDFDLPDWSRPGGSARVSRSSLAGRPLLVMFLCNHCPFVKHLRGGLAALARDYAARGVGIVAINANDPEKYPADAPPNMADEARDAGYTFPYLFDATQDVAKAFKAACTPDFFLYDRDHRLAYRGQFDASRPPGRDGAATIPVTGADLRAALDALLAGRPAPARQLPSIGCNIKWKAGNEPEYAR